MFIGAGARRSGLTGLGQSVCGLESVEMGFWAAEVRGAEIGAFFLNVNIFVR